MARKGLSDSSKKNGAFIPPTNSLLNPHKHALDFFSDSKTVKGTDDISSTETSPVPPGTKQQEDFLSIPELKEKADALVEAAGGLANILNNLRSPAFYLDENASSFGITIANGQCLVVCSGSIAKESTVGRGGELIVRDGATAEYITLAKGAKLTVRKGGKALNVVNVGGEINAEEDAIVTFMMPKEETSVKVIGMTLETSPLYLEKNHKGINLTIAKDQKLILCSGSTAENTTVEKGGEIIIRDNAKGVGIILNGGKLTVRKDGVALDVVVNTGGKVCVEGGGTVQDPIVKVGGEIGVENGGIAYDVVDAGGAINAEENALITYGEPNLPIKKIRKMKTSPLYLEKHHIGINLTVAKDQKLIVCSGSTAESTTVEKGGEIIIRDDAEGNGITLNGGKLTVRTGGKAHHVLNNGGVIDAAEDAVITFATASAKMPAKNTEKPASAEKKPVRKAEAKKASAEKKPVRKAEAKKVSKS